MAAISGYLAAGTAITDGVLQEPLSSAGYARRAVTVDVNDAGQIVLAAGVAFGPATAAWGPLAVLALIASDGTTIRRRATLATIAVPIGGFLIVPAGALASTAVDAGPDAEVLTLGAVPVTFNSEPITEGVS